MNNCGTKSTTRRTKHQPQMNVKEIINPIFLHELIWD